MTPPGRRLRPTSPSFVPFVFSFVAFVCVVFVALVAAQPPPARIVSLVPALTDMLVAIGARPQLVAVSSYDDGPEVKGLPKVGALLDPDVERILTLRPDLVLLYGSQADLMTQLTRASIPYFEYRHGGLPHIMTTIRDLGQRVGRPAQAETLASGIEQRLAAVRARIGGRARPRTLLVFGRERGALRAIYASGGRGFLHEMLEAAGGVNVFGDVQAESVQASSELILARAPQAIIELRSIDAPSDAAAQKEMTAWQVLSSVPAVRGRRVYLLTGDAITVPGPLVADGVERMARLLHPQVFP